MIIAGAGGAAHLPGMLAAVTPLPVIGVPVPLKYLDGMDSLLSIVQMPAGVPVATVAIGNARNAGLLGRTHPRRPSDPQLRQRMLDFQDQLRTGCRGQGCRRPGRTPQDQGQRRPASAQPDGAVGEVGGRCAGLLTQGFAADRTSATDSFLLGAIPPADHFGDLHRAA